jgi:hypothetical protein
MSIKAKEQRSSKLNYPPELNYPRTGKQNQAKKAVGE